MAKIKDITQKDDAGEQIEVLKQKTISLTPWADLKKEYDPNEHPVKTDPNYTDVPKKDGIEKVTRLIFDFQRLAVNRMSQLTFGIPVKRTYKPQSDTEKKAAKIIENIYTKNRIDSVNM